MQVNQFSNISNIVEALQYLSSEGFTKSFVSRGDGLYCLETEQLVDPESLSIVCYHRFEGSKDMGNVSVVYAVAGEPDLKGVIVDGYSTYTDADLADCIKRLNVNVPGVSS